jgi:hypothetical protein
MTALLKDTVCASEDMWFYRGISLMGCY